MNYLIGTTGEAGLHSGRDRWHVYCILCKVVVHEATTGPIEMIQSHEKYEHNNKVITENWMGR